MNRDEFARNLAAGTYDLIVMDRSSQPTSLADSLVAHQLSFAVHSMGCCRKCKDGWDVSLKFLSLVPNLCLTDWQKRAEQKKRESRPARTFKPPCFSRKSV